LCGETFAEIPKLQEHQNLRHLNQPEIQVFFKGSRIRIRIEVKNRILIRIKVKSREL
jgi:hypothetical protein